MHRHVTFFWFPAHDLDTGNRPNCSFFPTIKFCQLGLKICFQINHTELKPPTNTLTFVAHLLVWPWAWLPSVGLDDELLLKPKWPSFQCDFVIILPCLEFSAQDGSSATCSVTSGLHSVGYTKEISDIYFFNVCIFSRSFQPGGETWHLHLGVVGCGFGFVGDNFDWTEKVR